MEIGVQQSCEPPPARIRCDDDSVDVREIGVTLAKPPVVRAGILQTGAQSDEECMHCSGNPKIRGMIRKPTKFGRVQAVDVRDSGLVQCEYGFHFVCFQVVNIVVHAESLIAVAVER